MIRSTHFSYGSTAGIVTSVSLVIGLHAVSASQAAIVSGLLIVALADNLTDTLSIHVYQEAAELEAREVFRSTLANFGARLLVSLTFVFLVLVTPVASAVIASVAWGLILIVALTWALARQRGVSVSKEIIKHLSVATLVILLSKVIGAWITAHLP